MIRPGTRSRPVWIETLPGGALHALAAVIRLHARAVAAQGAVLADRVGPLEDPVLPRRQAAEYLAFHGLRAHAAQVRLHAGQGIGREAGALLEVDPHLVVPVDLVVRGGDETEFLAGGGVEHLADALACPLA